MSEQPRFRLVGFVVPQPDIRNIRMASFPCFVLPLFQSDGEIWIQDGNTDGRISEFVAFRPTVDMDPNSLRELIERFGPFGPAPNFMRGVIRYGHPRMYLWSSDDFGFPADVFGEDPKDYVTVGQPIRYGFVETPWQVLYGDKVILQTKLKNNSQRDQWSPFVSAEVAEFLGDKGWYQESIEAAATLIAFDNESISTKWREFMLKSEFGGNDENLED